MSLRWWWASRMTGRCTRWESWSPGSGGRLKVLNWNLHPFQLLEIIQVLDSISWVRCASGNVFFHHWCQALATNTITIAKPPLREESEQCSRVSSREQSGFCLLRLLHPVVGVEATSLNLKLSAQGRERRSCVSVRQQSCVPSPSCLPPICPH